MKRTLTVVEQTVQVASHMRPARPIATVCLSFAPTVFAPKAAAQTGASMAMRLGLIVAVRAPSVATV